MAPNTTWRLHLRIRLSADRQTIIDRVRRLWIGKLDVFAPAIGIKRMCDLLSIPRIPVGLGVCRCLTGSVGFLLLMAVPIFASLHR